MRGPSRVWVLADTRDIGDLRAAVTHGTGADTGAPIVGPNDIFDSVPMDAPEGLDALLPLLGRYWPQCRPLPTAADLRAHNCNTAADFVRARTRLSTLGIPVRQRMNLSAALVTFIGSGVVIYQCPSYEGRSEHIPHAQKVGEFNRPGEVQCPTSAAALRGADLRPPTARPPVRRPPFPMQHVQSRQMTQQRSRRRLCGEMRGGAAGQWAAARCAAHARCVAAPRCAAPSGCWVQAQGRALTAPRRRRRPRDGTLECLLAATWRTVAWIPARGHDGFPCSVPIRARACGHALAIAIQAVTIVLTLTYALDWGLRTQRNWFLGTL
eukprot:gene48287-17150_t